MEASSFPLATGLVDKAYIDQGQTALKRRQALVKTLLSQRKLPTAGFDDASIEQLPGDLPPTYLATYPPTTYLPTYLPTYYLFAFF